MSQCCAAVAAADAASLYSVELDASQDSLASVLEAPCASAAEQRVDALKASGVTSNATKKSSGFKSRSVSVTYNLPRRLWAGFKSEDDVPEELRPKVMDKTVKYAVGQLEIGETGNWHYQIYAEGTSAKSVSAWQKSLRCPGAHIESRKGTQEEMREYCMKEDTAVRDRPDVFAGFEHGEWVPQEPGKRSDLLEMKRRIDDGATEMDLYEYDFNSMARMSKAFCAYMDAKNRSKHRTWMTKGKWLFGGTGVGKSHLAFTGFKPDTHYVMEISDKGWWDGYCGQKTVILNDFRGQIQYAEMLTLVDKWPKSVPRRGRAPSPFLAEDVIVTSSMHPIQVYSNLHEKESIQQLLRRFDVFEVTEADDGTKGQLKRMSIEEAIARFTPVTVPEAAPEERAEVQQQNLRMLYNLPKVARTAD